VTGVTGVTGADADGAVVVTTGGVSAGGVSTGGVTGVCPVVSGWYWTAAGEPVPAAPVVAPATPVLPSSRAVARRTAEVVRGVMPVELLPRRDGLALASRTLDRVSLDV
jgi:hypothetical protein